jgi:hypothetical protein
MPPYHLETTPDLPDSVRAKARPIRSTLYDPALKEFGRMRTYFYAPSTSSYASPLVCAPKETDPHIRLCGDHREINKFITIPQEPIPNVPLSIAKCASFSLFIDLDMSNSFHQIPLDEVSSNLLSVATPWGLFRPLFLPEGVGPASGILQKIVRRIFADFNDWIIVIFDNFLVLANDFDDAYVKLEKILNVCKLHGIVLKMKKCWIGVEQVTFFGYQINPGSWSLSQQRKDSIHALLFPTNQKMMQSFLGCANFFHTHVPDYAKWSSELYDCTAATFNWDKTTWKKDYRLIFEKFKTAIQDAVTLNFPDYSLPWVVRCDSSDIAAGAVLYQEFTDSTGTIIHQPIAFISHKYSGAAVNWATYKQEAFAAYFSVLKLQRFLIGKHFTLETDHRNLLWMEKSTVPIIVRWRVLLQSYNFSLRHIPGKDNKVADWLSRMHPVLPSPVVLNTTTTTTPQELFDTVHGGRSLHFGAKRTYLALCERYPGHKIPFHTVQTLVAECPACQKNRLPFQPLPHSEIRETLLHHTRFIGIDHVSVTPPDEDGYIGLLLIVELDTKFPQAYPVRDYTALTVATILFRHYCTFGTYNGILSDPGTALMAEVVHLLNTWLGIPHHVSLVGRHESNGTEHVNALFIGHLRRLVHDERLQHRWASDTVLPLINHALCTSPNAELGGLSPAELKFGTVDSHRFHLPDPLPPGHSYGAFVNNLDHNLQIVRAATLDYQNTLRSSRVNTTPHDLQNIYQPGQLILFNPREHSKSFRSSKLASNLLGPYRVISQSKNDILCVHTHLQTSHTFHTSRVCPYIGDDTIGLLDKDVYLIDKIISHKGSFSKLRSLTFRVVWLNCPGEDTMEPWSHLVHTHALHAYLTLKQQAHLIPTQYQVSS